MPPVNFWINGPALAAGLAFFTSLTTLGFAWYSAASNAHSEAKKAQMASRAAVLQRLTNYYMTTRDNISSEMMAGLALPPTDWLDAQLAAMHQDWRMKDYQAIRP
jgi:hypothetical protein